MTLIRYIIVPLMIIITLLSCSSDSSVVVDIDGNSYSTIKIGDQIWMAENLRVKHYRNGDDILNLIDNKESANVSSVGKYCYYNNEIANAEKYGALYSGLAVLDSRNLAPEGWHIASDEEWKQLEIFLGMSQSDANKGEVMAEGIDRGTNEASKLAGMSDLWNEKPIKEGEEFGTSNFNGVPGGIRSSNQDGRYWGEGVFGNYWTTTKVDNLNMWMRSLATFSTKITRAQFAINQELSVRCVKD